ncbi:hypothetical protein Tco_0018926 [Tanacetum coccineum]
MPTHNRIYIAPSHTKKIFGNIRRVGKGFSGRETPLFQTMVVQDQAKIGEGSTNPTDPHHTPTFIQPSTSQPQKKQKSRKDTQIAQSSGPTKHVADEDSGNIAKTQSKATPNESSSLGTTSGGGPKSQETMGDIVTQTRFENVSKHSNDPLLSRDKESLGEDASKQERINAIDVDEDITLVNDQDDADMFDVNTLTGDEVLVEQEVATKDVNLTIDEVTLAQALAALKSVKSKANVVEEPSVPVSAVSTKVSAATTITTATILISRKGIVITELGTSTTTTTISSQPSQEKVQDKGKGIMVEPEKPLKKKDQISLDEQEAVRLQVAFDEEERLAREKDEANLAQRLQAEEQEQFTTKQKATLFKELLEQRRKHFAAKRAEENRNKPPTKSQQKKTMITYLKKWKNRLDGRLESLREYSVLDWKLYDSCGVHSLRMQHMHIHMLVEKRYPLTPATITVKVSAAGEFQ